MSTESDEPPLLIVMRNEKGEVLKSFYWWHGEASFRDAFLGKKIHELKTNEH